MTSYYELDTLTVYYIVWENLESYPCFHTYAHICTHRYMGWLGWKHWLWSYFPR